MNQLFPFRWPKYLSFNFSISAANEYSGLTSFRIHWFDLVVQGTLKSLLQHHSINSSACSLVYGPTLTCVHDYWKNHSFDYMDLCRSSDVTVFLPRSKCLLISWLQSPSTVILEPRKIKSVTVSTFSPSICHEVMGLDVMILSFLFFFFILSFLNVEF